MQQTLERGARSEIALSHGSTMTFNGRGKVLVTVAGQNTREIVILGVSQQIGPYTAPAQVAMLGLVDGLLYEVFDKLQSASGPVTITGSAVLGGTLTGILARGWRAETWQWIRVAADGTETVIAGAASPSYVLVEADVADGVTVYPRGVRLSFGPGGIAASSGGGVTPALSISGSLATSGTVGTAYTSDFNAAGGSGSYTFSVQSGTLPAGLTLNASTGTVSGTPTTAATSSGIVIRVTDTAGATADSSSYAITIAAASAPLAISGTPSTTAQVGTAYSFTPSASGGTTPRTFSIASGTLPAGLSINSSTGAITGTPTTTGTSSGIVVRVTDAASATADLAAFSITVSAATLTISGTPPTTGQVGTAYSFTPTSTGGVTPKTYSIFSGTLPAGLSINASTGAVTGTPTTAGTSSGIVIRVTDNAGTTANLAAFNIAVAAAPIDTRPLWFRGPSNAATVGTEAWLAGATALAGSANGGASGTMTVQTTGASITASISGTTLTVSAVASGAVAIGQNVVGAGIAVPTVITAGSGTTWTVSASQTVASQAMTTGDYIWVAPVASAVPSGLHVTEPTDGAGGFSGAGLTGNNGGASPDPATTYVEFTQSNGTVRRLFRNDFRHAVPTAKTYTVSAG